METILLGTSILIEHRRAKDKSTSRLFEMSGRFLLAISTITVFELWRGDNSGEDEFWQTLFLNCSLLDFDFESAKIAGRDFLFLQKQGLPIDVEDVLIGAVAKRNNLKLATGNQRHFSRIPDLQLYPSL